MKKMWSISALVLVIFLGVSSCKKDDNSSNDSNSASVLNSTVQQGKWRVSSFIDNGNNETNHYSGYEFQFNANGILIASSNGNTISGTWSSGNDDSQLKLVLNFGTITPFEELNDDWHVIQQNSLILKLEDVSGGNGGTDYLTFEKI